MVVHDFIREGTSIFSVYKEFSKFSGLKLNIPKTVVIPLWECVPARAQPVGRAAIGLVRFTLFVARR